MNSIFWLINTIIDLYVMVLVINVVMSWLVSFNVVNTRNRVVYMIGDFLYRATEPALKPIRRVMPNLGGLDLSSLILIIGLIFVQRLMLEMVY